MILSTDTLVKLSEHGYGSLNALCISLCKPCIDRFVVKSFGRKNSKCQAVSDDIPQSEEGEANEEA